MLNKQKEDYMRIALHIYYLSKLAGQISNGIYGIENMDAKYLAEDLIQNEPELFREAGGCAGDLVQ